MKKLISILLVVMLAVAFAACGKNESTDISQDPEVSVESENTDALDKSDEAESKNDNAVTDNKKPSSNPSETKPAENNAKPQAKPQTNPENVPDEKPDEKPAEKPVEKPAEKPATLGNKLLADFKAKASGMSALDLANALVTNPVIEFSGGATPIEEGLLSGFGNTEIKGFKSGAMFAPMIGSIPFVGYVFELENASDVPAFISTLKSNADLRWNICVEADEMVAGSVGTKVFFVMCPTSLEG